MSRLEFAIAVRYLRSRHGSRLLSLISLIAVGGVIVGVSALIVILGVMNGLQHDLREKILVGSPDIRVLPYGGDMILTDWRSTLATVKRQPGVIAAAPFVYSQALARRTGSAYNEGVFFMGIDADTGAGAVTQIRTQAISGDFSFATQEGTRGVVLGTHLANRLQVTPGLDSVTLISGNLNAIDAFTGRQRISEVTLLVTGVFATGMYEYDDKYIFMALPVAQQVAQLDSAVTGIEVRTATREDASRVGIAMQDTLGMGLRTEDWQHQNSGLFSALKLEKMGMTFILMLIVLVAAFNIVSTLTMVVTDKTREIGILRAMGMSAASIRRIFFAQGMVIGAVGTAIGLVLGVGVGMAVGRLELIKLDAKVYFIDHLPIRMEPLDIVVIVAASLGVAALATLLPARQASRLVVVDAIRHE